LGQKDAGTKTNYCNFKTDKTLFVFVFLKLETFIYIDTYVDIESH